MRASIALSMLAVLTLSAGPAVAQEAEALRKELAEMRRQFEAMRDGYERKINELGERLQKLEAPPAAAATAPAPSPPAAGQVAPVPPPPAQLSAMDLARPRQPFALYERRGAGQLLLDIGLAGDFIGNLTQNNVQQAQGGTFPGLENYFFPREVELSLFGQVDPYARAEIRFEAEQEDRGQGVSVSLGEATLTLMTLPYSTQAKLGQMRNRFGLTNQIHEHDLPFVDRPDVLRQFFGQDGLVEKGGELTWVAPLPFYLEALVGLFNGDNETAFGWASLRNPLVTGRLRTFLELDEWGALQLGASVASGITTQDLRNTILGADAKYKFTPDGWPHPLVTLAGEFLYQIRKVNVFGAPPAENGNGNGEPDSGASSTASVVTGTKTLDRYGWYVYGELQPFRFGPLSRLSAGFRYDWTEYPTSPGHQWAVGPYLSYSPSEFLRFRLGYKHTEGNTAGCCSLTGVGSARIKDEYFLQSTFILGAHPTHPF